MDPQFHLNIRQLLLAPAGRAPDQVILGGDGHGRTYQQFHDRVSRLSGLLSRFGLAGRTVAVMDWDTPRYLECFFAVPMIGATLHTINIRLSPEQILYTINHAEDDAILCHEDFLPILLPLLHRILRPVELILLSERADATPPEGFAGEYEALLSTSPPGYDFPILPEDTRATLFYTTGTTGEPKGVTYTHRQLVLHTLAVAADLGSIPGKGGLKRDDVYMPITPLFHVHGWGFPYIATFLGLKQVYPGRYDPARLLALIAKHGVTFSHCVPTILAMVLGATEAASTDLSRWKVLIGGSALSEGLARQARALGIDLHAAYGLSETCPFVTHADMLASQANNDVTLRTATGRPSPLVEVRIVAEDMTDAPMDGKTTGEVVARAPWLTHGYLKNQAASSELWRGGWLHTGDVGHMAPDGTLRITDRLKDVIKSGGEWVSSLVLENLVSTVPGLVEVAAVGVPDARWGERPVLVVVAGPDAAVDVAIRQRLGQAIAAGDLPKWASPDRICQVAALPRTSVGKIDKKRIRQMLQAGEIV